jgi:hypothetical protein
MIPSNWTGCLGVVNNYESLLPSKKALFDIAATRITSSYLAFLLDQSWNGGENALYASNPPSLQPSSIWNSMTLNNKVLKA